MAVNILALESNLLNMKSVHKLTPSDQPHLMQTWNTSPKSWYTAGLHHQGQCLPGHSPRQRSRRWHPCLCQATAAQSVSTNSGLEQQHTRLELKTKLLETLAQPEINRGIFGVPVSMLQPCEQLPVTWQVWPAGTSCCRQRSVMILPSLYNS